jgi:hypothetical protein
VKQKGSKRGELHTGSVRWFHTRGETPRHFQFDNSGQYLLVANQDTDSITVFNFNLSNGELKYSGNEYRVPSPNFVCCCPTHSEGDEDGDDEHYTPKTLASQLNLNQMRTMNGGGCSGNSSSSSSSDSERLQQRHAGSLRNRNNIDERRIRSPSCDSDVTTDGSEGSTFLASNKHDNDANLKEELEKAKREIEMLRKQLAGKA